MTGLFVHLCVCVCAGECLAAHVTHSSVVLTFISGFIPSHAVLSPVHLSLSLSGVSSLTRWYYGNINRVKAEKLLLASQNKDGSFLVRISESHSDEYTISGRLTPPLTFTIYPLIKQLQGSHFWFSS